MLDNIMNQIAESSRNFIDQLSLDLLKRAGMPVKENMSNFEIVMLCNDMQKYGLRLKMSKNYDNNDLLAVYKMYDLNEELICGYVFETRVEENKISIVAVPVE